MSQITEDILANTDIVDIVSKYITLKKVWSNFSALSPFQSEKTPSLMVSPQKQIFKDFSSGKGWNVITFVMEIERVDFRDAIKILAEHARIDISKYQHNPEKFAEIQDEKEKIKRIHHLAYEFFLKSFEQNKNAQKYVYDQRHIDKNLTNVFQVGYAPDSHYDLVTFLKEKWFSQQDCIDASLAGTSQSGDMYSFFRKRIMFPICDHLGSIIGFGWRSIDPNDQPKYLNSKEHRAYDKSQILYGLHLAKNHINTHKKLIVVEWYMDVIALHRLNLPIGVATCGTAITEQHVKIMSRYTDDIYFLFDSDQAWLQATIRWLKIAYEQNTFPKIIVLPNQHKDIDELANETNAQKTIDKAIQDAQDWFSYIFTKIKEQEDRTSPIGKQKVLNTMFELIVHIDSMNIQMHYLQVLAESLWMSYEILYPQYKKFAKSDGKLHIQKMQEKQQNTHKHSIQWETMIAALLHDYFLDNYDKTVELRKPLKQLLEQIAVAMPDSIIWQAHKWTVSDEQTNLLHETQLRRAKELDTLIDEQKIYRQICKTILTTVQKHKQQMLKWPQLDHEQKKNIQQLVQKVFG